jgi:hypothetical protein
VPGAAPPDVPLEQAQEVVFVSMGTTDWLTEDLETHSLHLRAVID